MAEILWKIILGYSQALLNQVRQHLGKLKINLSLYPTCHHCSTWINIIKTAIIKINSEEIHDVLTRLLCLPQWFSWEIIDKLKADFD